MSYEIRVRPAAAQALRKVDHQDRPRIQATISLLAHAPRPPGAKKLTGRDAVRVRVGDYRIVYTVEDNVLLIVIVTLGDRRDIYDK